MENVISRDGFQLFYKKEGAGPLLLMIHGVACDSDYFDQAVVFLKEQFTVVTYDRRGYSRSVCTCRERDTVSDYSIKAQVEDAAVLIRMQNQGPAFAVGCSAGGVVALELAQTFPELISGLLLQEPPIVGNRQIREQMNHWIQQLQDAIAKKRINQAVISLKNVLGGTDRKVMSKGLEAQRQDLENFMVFLTCEMEEFLTYHVQHQEVHGRTDKEKDREKLSLLYTVTVGACSEGGLFAKAADSVAQQMGWELIRNPGYHNFPADMPLEFSKLVSEVFDRSK